MTAASKRKLHIYSGGFNYHARKPWPARADLFVDLRRRFRNPIDDPELHELTGLAPQVREYVFAAPGAPQYMWSIRAAARAIMLTHEEQDATIVIACAGGRHRSVAFVDAIVHYRDGFNRRTVLSAEGWRVSVTHLHIDMTECAKCEQYHRDYAWRTCPEHQPAERFDPFK